MRPRALKGADYLKFTNLNVQSGVTAIDFDREDQKVYWVETDVIYRANYDGTDQETFLIQVKGDS